MRGFTYQPRILRTRIRALTDSEWNRQTNDKMQRQLRWGGEDTWSIVKQF